MHQCLRFVEALQRFGVAALRGKRHTEIVFQRRGLARPPCALRQRLTRDLFGLARTALTVQCRDETLFCHQETGLQTQRFAIGFFRARKIFLVGQREAEIEMGLRVIGFQPYRLAKGGHGFVGAVGGFQQLRQIVMHLRLIGLHHQ